MVEAIYHYGLVETIKRIQTFKFSFQFKEYYYRLFIKRLLVSLFSRINVLPAL